MGRFHRHADGTAHEDHGDDHDHDHGSDGADHGEQHRDVGDHSGYGTGALRVEVLEHILGENDRTAAANRRDFDAAGVAVVNLMSSPGAGKTTVLERTLERLAGQLRIGVVEGDIQTSLDADRLAAHGAAVSLLNTANGFGGECHLDATMVRSALPRLPLADLDLVVVENVGNLVCPAEFAVGEDSRAMVCSLTEGEDKPLKYPVMFRSADVVLLNKMDLLPHLDADPDLFLANLSQIHPGVRVIPVSARTGDGIDEWCDWLAGLVRTSRTGPR